MRLGGAASNAAAQLMQLRQSEALGVLDDHDGGIGNVDADFHNGGGHQDLDFILAELLHHSFFFFAGKAAVQKTEFQLGKYFAGETFEFLDGSFHSSFDSSITG
jgi:hypothetical protein